MNKNYELAYIILLRCVALLGFACIAFLLTSGYITAFMMIQNGYGNTTVTVELPAITPSAMVIWYSKASIFGMFLLWIYLRSGERWKEYKGRWA